MYENRSEGLLVRVELLGPVRWLCHGLIEEIHGADGELLLVAECARAAADNTVLVKAGLE